MKYILVGDMHVQPSNVNDSNIIFDKIASLVNKEVNHVVFLGDMFHTHSVVRTEVMDCVFNGMTKLLSVGAKVVYISGNHDNQTPKATDTITAPKYILPKEVLFIDHNIDKPVMISENVYGIGFIGDNERFVELVRSLDNPNATIFHHQTLAGAKYENGFPAHGAIEFEEIKCKQFIGGHIHTSSDNGKSWYPGSPRAITKAEVNMDKGVYAWDSETGARAFHSLNKLVKTFKKYEILEENGLEVPELDNPEFTDKDNVTVLVKGSQDFYDALLKKYKKMGKIGFVRDVKVNINKTIDTNKSNFTIDTLYHEYVFKVSKIPDSMKGDVWKELQRLVPNLGSSN